MDKKISKIDFKKLLSSDKARNVFIITGLVAIVLIFLSSRTSADKNTNISKSFDTEAYHSSLTNEIKTMVESIEGAGNARVMITLDNSYEYVYLDDDETIRQVNEPVIRGVAVACEGGDDPVVTAQITNLLKTILGISANKVCVSKLT